MNVGTEAPTMHIGFLQTYFSRSSVGGGELHTERLARALRRRGHEITIFTDEPRQRRDGIGDLDVREYPTPVKRNPITELLTAQRAFGDMKECDVVTLTDDSAWRGVDLPVPTAMVFHVVWHGWVNRHRPLWRVLRTKPQALVYRHMERKICREADAIVSISPNVREDILLVEEGKEKIIDIPNGVDTERFTPGEARYDEFTVYFQGRLVEMKNPNILVEATARSDENWRLILGGEGPLREELESAVARHGIEDRVDFLGYVSDEELPGRYANADVFVLPSKYEGMPLTVLEAAASGTAIVASPRAATDFVTSEMGAVIEPNPHQIANTLDELARHPDRVTEMGTAARTRAEQYSWDAIAQRYEELYENLIGD